MPLPEDVIGGPAQLTWYIGQDDCLYAHELQTNCLFKIIEDISKLVPPPVDAGVPEAPTDGQLYGRENSAWAVVPNPSGEFIAAAGNTVINRANIPILISPDTVRSVTLDCNGIGIGSIASGVTNIQPNSIQIQDTTVTGNTVTNLHMDPATGDLIATGSGSGPNAGKSVNLTAGKWA